MQLDVSEPDCEVLEELLNQTLGNLRAKIATTSIAEEDFALEHRELLVHRMLARVSSRRAAWRAESASLDGLVGPDRRWQEECYELPEDQTGCLDDVHQAICPNLTRTGQG